MSDKILELKNVIKYYGDKKVLNDINIELFFGKILGLIGLSGLGKIIIIKCLMGMESLNEGYVKIFDINMFNRKLLNDIGYMG